MNTLNEGLAQFFLDLNLFLDLSGTIPDARNDALELNLEL